MNKITLNILILILILILHLLEEIKTGLRKKLPVLASDRQKQFREWDIPEDTHKYILSKNLVPLIEQICECKDFSHRQVGVFLGQRFKRIEGIAKPHKNFNEDIISDLFNYLCKKKLSIDLAGPMLEILYEHPKMRYESILTTLNFRKKSMDELLAPVDFLYEKYIQTKNKADTKKAVNWLMGQVRKQATGNVNLSELSEEIRMRITTEKN